LRQRPVYIVDDDSIVRRSISLALSSSGYSPRSFASGRDFLEEAGALSAGCVLLDVRMPDVSGIDVLASCDRLATLPVIVMTGHGDIATAVAAMKHGASDFLEKPFEDSLLLALLERLFATLPDTLDSEAERADAIARVKALKPRERDILRGLVAGLANKEIAERLALSVRTVEMHRARMMKSLQARSIAHCLQAAQAAGLTAL
jgi:two-component system response regulator FixJ